MEQSPKYTTFWAINENFTIFLIEIVQCPFSEHNEIKLVTNNRKITWKPQDIWRLSKTCLSKAWVKEEISREI